MNNRILSQQQIIFFYKSTKFPIDPLIELIIPTKTFLQDNAIQELDCSKTFSVLGRNRWANFFVTIGYLINLQKIAPTL